MPHFLRLTWRAGTATLGDAIWWIQAFLTAVVTWLFGDLVLFHPFHPALPSYAWWIAHGSELYWARWAALSIAVGLAGLLAPRRYFNIRLASAGYLGFTHAVVAFGFYSSNPHGTGTGTYILIMCLAMVRIWLEKRW